MTQKQQSPSASESARIRAEAAAWIARLHGPDRTAADDIGFQRWLKVSPAHEHAFEQMTDLWDVGARLKTDTLEGLRKGSRASRSRMRFVPVAIATAALAVLAAISIAFYMNDAAITTGVGEQHIRTLKDGTRITLNTATRLKVRYDDNQRRIELESGEALFEVAKRPDWPFVVSIDEKEVIALGTTFIVRHDDRQTAVTLLEGKVEVTAPRDRSGAATPEPAALQQNSAAPSLGAGELEVTASKATRLDVILVAGQRVTFAGGEPPKLDAPPLEKVTAWKQGLVELDNTPLSDAIAEMNRYSVVPLVFEQPGQTNVRVSGVFRAGDSLEFARAVASAYGLNFHESPDALTLTATP